MKKSLGTLLCAAALGVSATSVSAAVIESRFDADAEGWGTGRIQLAVDPLNPLPDITVFDAVDYDATRQMLQSFDAHDWNTFRSPAAYSGKLSAFYGGAISYDLQDAYNDPGQSWPNIGILGKNATLIFIPTPPPATASLTHYEFALDTSAGWLKTPFSLGSFGFPAASSADIQAVLDDVIGIWINADWKTGDGIINDDSRLDNVCLRDRLSSCTAAAPLAVPAPGSLELLGLGVCLLGLLGLPGRRQRSEATSNSPQIRTRMAGAVEALIQGGWAVETLSCGIKIRRKV